MKIVVASSVHSCIMNTVDDELSVQMISKKIVQLARPIFMGYMMRELGTSEKASAFEFDNNLTINGVVRQQQSYLTMRREHDTIVNELGALSRSERKQIYAIFEASLNAASWSI